MSNASKINITGKINHAQNNSAYFGGFAYLFGKGTFSSVTIDMKSANGACYARNEDTYWGAAWVDPQAAGDVGVTTWKGQEFKVLVETDLPHQSKSESDAYYAKGF